MTDMILALAVYWGTTGALVMVAWYCPRWPK